MERCTCEPQKESLYPQWAVERAVARGLPIRLGRSPYQVERHFGDCPRTDRLFVDGQPIETFIELRGA